MRGVVECEAEDLGNDYDGQTEAMSRILELPGGPADLPEPGEEESEELETEVV